MTVTAPSLAGASVTDVPARLARSWLLVSALALDEATRAYDAGVDALVVDIEDAVPEPDKSAARSAMLDWLARRPAWVRVSDVSTPHWADDVAALSASPGVLGVMLAKVESAQHVADTADALPGGTRIVALIESARGIQSVASIAEQPATFRLAFGSGDFRRDTGIADDPLALAYPRSQLVIASAAAGLPGPIDGPALGDAVADAARHAKTMGMTGKLSLRLEQVGAINEALSPTPDEIESAREVLARADGGVVDGSYLPALARARQVVALARAYGVGAGTRTGGTRAR